MSNHAELIRLEESKPVSRRGRHFIEFDLGNNSKRFVTTIDPLHIRDSDTEIDTEWIPDTGAWQWKIRATDFEAHARSVFNVGNLYEWRLGGEWIIVDPQSINWINQDNSREQIAIKQAVTGTVNDYTLHFENAYGTGRHFEYIAHPKRMIKHFIITDRTYLPEPAVWLTGTIWFEVEFTITNSAGIELYIDGERWDRSSTRLRTSERIEFRNVSNDVVWYADAPTAEDANGDIISAQYEIRAQSGLYFITVRVPKTWIDTAVFPIVVDPTFTDGYGGDVNSAYDAYLSGTNTTTNYGGSTGMVAYIDARTILMRFDFASLPASYICNTANLYLYAYPYESTRVRNVRVYLMADGNKNWSETGCTWVRRTAAGEPWVGEDGCKSEGVDYFYPDIGSLQIPKGYYDTSNEHIILLDASAVEKNFARYLHLVILNLDPSNAYFCSSDHATLLARPKLVIDYTEDNTLDLSITPDTTRVRGIRIYP